MVLTHNGTTQLTRYYLGGQYELDAETGTERLYLGGDAYSTPAVYVKEAGNWNIYYICRDYQGSITHIVNTNGSLKQELSYDPWGRLRDPNTQQIYAVGAEPVLFLARGYTGHEHLTVFGLINMNARLYDPALGRFLSPDPYVQSPGNSQNFNRYSYCLNNPLKYTDQSGEVVEWIAIGAVALFMYLKASHDYAPKENQGNPLKWAWNPGDWFQPSPSNPNGGIPYFEIGGGASTDGSGAHGYFSFGNPNQPMPTIGYHADYGWGGGYNQYGNTSMYYPTYNYFAPEQAVLSAEQEAKTKYYNDLHLNTSSLGTDFYVGTGITVIQNLYYSKEFGTWMGKDFKIRYQNWGGNGTTGGKYSFAKNTGSKIGILGKLVGAYSMYNSYDKWQNNEISTPVFTGDMVSGLAGIFGGIYGSSWSIGYELGKNYGPSKWFAPEQYESVILERLKTNKIE